MPLDMSGFDVSFDQSVAENLPRFTLQPTASVTNQEPDYLGKHKTPELKLQNGWEGVVIECFDQWDCCD